MKLPYRFGRYTLQKKLASGGMAEIYRARYEGEGGFSKVVAIKRILPTLSADDHFTQMFMDEARVLTHLQHQNIVQVFELGRCEGQPFLSMEFVDGIDLRQLFTRMARSDFSLPRRLALFIIDQLLQGLDFAHRSVSDDGSPLDIIHRDISPSNILVSYNGEVKITDFGIAKGAHRSKETTAVGIKGKYAYMSPEQARGETIDQRSDIFSTGIVFFELLTARRLFEAASDLETLEHVKRANLPPEVLQMFPPELQTIFYFALAPSRETRYQTVAEFLAEIHRFLRSSGELAYGFELGTFLRDHFSGSTSCFLSDHVVDKGDCDKIMTQRYDRQRIMGRPRHKGRLMMRAIIISVIACAFWGPVRNDGLNLPSVFASREKVTKVSSSPVILPEADPPVPSVPFKDTKAFSTISVQARPWGYVTIPQYAVRRETPLTSLNVNPGTHIIKVHHPPSNRLVTTHVTVAEGERRLCLAQFSERPSITCR